MQSFGLTFVRAATFVFCVPPFFGRPLSFRLRLGFAVLLASIAGIEQNVQESTITSGLPMLLLQEIIVGFALGCATASILAAFQMGGSLIGRLSGGSLVSTASSEENGSPLTAFYYGVATSLLFLTGGHRVVIDGLLQSFTSLPVGVEWSMPSVTVFLGQLIGASFGFALRIAGPVAFALLAASIVTALIARFVRTFSFFGVGMSLNAALLVGALLISIAFLPSLFEQHFAAAFEIATEFLRSIRV